MESEVLGPEPAGASPAASVGAMPKLMQSTCKRMESEVLGLELAGASPAASVGAIRKTPPTGCASISNSRSGTPGTRSTLLERSSENSKATRDAGTGWVKAGYIPVSVWPGWCGGLVCGAAGERGAFILVSSVCCLLRWFDAVQRLDTANLFRFSLCIDSSFCRDGSYG
jgi:hypothetical protein